jgi:hypothetical protein
MYFMRKIIFITAILTIALSGILYSQTEGGKVGEVKQISKTAGEVIVGSPTASKDIKMGDLLYVRVEGKAVQLRATFPMQTISKCRAEGPNRELWSKIKTGMTVYRWKTGIEDITPVQDAVVKPDETRTDKRLRLRTQRVMQ